MLGKTLNKKALKRIASAFLLAMLVISTIPCTVHAEESKDMITSFNDLKAAVRAAKDGDTLYVGDINFTPSGNIFNSLMRVETNKSLIIKSGKNDGKAVFTNGSFILSGSKTSDSRNTFHFENIIFDGGVDTSELTVADFDLQWSEEEEQYLLIEPLPAQYALQFKGNVDAFFTDCEFRNYTHEYGPVMNIHYADYTSEPYLLDLFGDYSACTLNLTLDRCRITGNAAFYDGGAIYIEGNNNVSLTARDCAIKNNYSGDGEYRFGGGAIYASGAKLSLERCRIENNSANHLFPDMELPPEDMLHGGGLCVQNAKLELINCLIVGNSASMGGGIALTNAEAVIDGCLFAGNRAEQHSFNWTGSLGPWNNMAQGGAIYHTGDSGAKTTVINSSIYNNSAENAYGGIYSYYNGNDDGLSVCGMELILCTYTGNTCDSVYDYGAPDVFPWCTHPGDILEIPYIKTTGCILIDDSFAKDFPHHELPSAENGYNYIASPADAMADSLNVVCPEVPGHVSVDVPEAMNFTVPNEYAQILIGTRYGGNLKNVHVGDNYDAKLYPTQEKTDNKKSVLYWIIPAVVVAAAVIAITLIIYRRRKKLTESSVTDVPVPEITKPAETVPTIVKAWFTKEEIDVIMKSLPKVQTLTGRETEVLIEMLEGKKQKEIAYDLGIEITTVKDFYRKIYDKLDLSNKDELLKRCSALISKS